MSVLLGIDYNAFIAYIDCTAIVIGRIMASLTVRNLPEDAKHRFRQAAAAHGRSMEEHLRQMILEAGFDNAQLPAGVKDMSAPYRHFAPAVPDPRAESRARIERLIALGRGLEDFELPPREVGTIKDVDFS